MTQAYMEKMIGMEDWAKEILSNDETSTDAELILHFVSEGVWESQAREWVKQRDFYLNNIVMADGTVYSPKGKVRN